MAKKATKTKIRKNDPVVTEILRNGIIAVTEEMKTNLMRTAYNIIIYEALDFTTGLFTPEGDTVSIGILSQPIIAAARLTAFMMLTWVPQRHFTPSSADLISASLGFFLLARNAAAVMIQPLMQ